MTEEKKRRKRSGEGWCIFGENEVGENDQDICDHELVTAGFECCADAENWIKGNPDEYKRFKQLLIMKIQKRIKLKVEQKTVVTFE